MAAATSLTSDNTFAEIRSSASINAHEKLGLERLRTAGLLEKRI